MTDTPPPPTVTATPAGDPVAGDAAATQRRRPALSPSRAADFKQCPLLYRFRTIDRLPERPTRAQVRGTVVHAVLERLYAEPAAHRSAERAHSLLAPVWREQLDRRPELADLFDGPNDPQLHGWLDSAGELLDAYFRLEDPRRLQPEACELLVEAELDSGLLLRGYVDRLDVAPTGEIRVVDYKTGSAPRQAFEAKALFQMKFYALVLYRLRDVVPRQLRLLYLASGEVLTYAPEAAELLRFERTLEAMWRAILTAGRSGDFRARPSKLCAWCDHKAHCPEYGGTPPPYPGWPDPEHLASAEETPEDRAE